MNGLDFRYDYILCIHSFFRIEKTLEGSKMWVLAKIDSQGRITIRKIIRDSLDLMPGEYVYVMIKPTGKFSPKARFTPDSGSSSAM